MDDQERQMWRKLLKMRERFLEKYGVSLGVNDLAKARRYLEIGDTGQLAPLNFERGQP